MAVFLTQPQHCVMFGDPARASVYGQLRWKLPTTRRDDMAVFLTQPQHCAMFGDPVMISVYV